MVSVLLLEGGMRGHVAGSVRLQFIQQVVRAPAVRTLVPLLPRVRLLVLLEHLRQPEPLAAPAAGVRPLSCVDQQVAAKVGGAKKQPLAMRTVVGFSVLSHHVGIESARVGISVVAPIVVFL